MTLPSISIVAVIFILAACSKSDKNIAKESTTEKAQITLEKPSDADFLAFMIYHHMEYMKTTAEQAGGTNRLLHTRELPTEGTDAVVTPALDHIYTKSVIDLTQGPVTVSFPEIEEGRYYSIHITDMEHYTIYDEIFPKGTYTFFRKGMKMEAERGTKLIECVGNYPHLFIRIQVFNGDDLANVYPIQDNISIQGVSQSLEFDNPIRFTLENRDVYQEHIAMLESSVNFTHEDYLRVSEYIGLNAPRLGAKGNFGKYGSIDSQEPGSNDMENRAAGIVGHLGLPVHHAYYQPYFTNCADEVLYGNKKEVFTFQYRPDGVELFWSVTRYSAITRNTLPGKNDLFNAYNTKPDENGNITITFSVENPDDGTYWMPVNLGEPYYFVCRYYMPDLKNLPAKPCD